MSKSSIPLLEHHGSPISYLVKKLGCALNRLMCLLSFPLRLVCSSLLPVGSLRFNLPSAGRALAGMVQAGVGSRRRQLGVESESLEGPCWLPCCPFGVHLCKSSDLEGEVEQRQSRGEREGRVRERLAW